MRPVYETDVLVVGSGIAGLSFALKVRDLGRVTILTKKEDVASNTNFAQGGIAAVVGEDDAPEVHIRDTLTAGAGLCRRDAVEILAREGPDRVRELVEWGVRFTTQGDGRFSLGMEGGHSRRRIVHCQDLTGREVERALLAALRASPNVELLEEHFVWDLILIGRGRGRRAVGVWAWNTTAQRMEGWYAPLTFLATGGAGQIFLHTTNPAIATGDGMAMAYRAGLALVNMEFIQFHPTALYPATHRAFLISEAVRGEGAVLRRRDGQAFMEGYHPRGSLAPRDVVARAVELEMRAHGDAYVLLDASPISPERFAERFPTILETCRRRGVHPPEEPIPVVPAAHYFCGGVATDTMGRTALPGLLAAGEVAWTGVHGANRLASNSLLEGVVFAHRAALGVWDHWRDLSAGHPPPADREEVSPPLPRMGVGSRDPEGLCRRLRALMWEKVGIIRVTHRLVEAEAEIRALQRQLRSTICEPETLVAWGELRNMVEVARAVVRAARWREESRGLHWTQDFPEERPEFQRESVVRRGWWRVMGRPSPHVSSVGSSP